MTKCPDPEEDFDGFIGAIVQEAIAEDAGIPGHLKNRHYARKAAEHLLGCLDLDLQINGLLAMACRRMIRNAQRLHDSIPAEDRWEGMDK